MRAVELLKEYTEYILYIDGKAITKYADEQKAVKDVEHLKLKYPNKNYEIKPMTMES